MKIFLIFAIICAAATSICAQGKLPKLSVDEIVSKHLASIGTPEARSAASSRVMIGEGALTSKIKTVAAVGGPAQFASTGDSVLLAMVFNANDYPYEKAAFDGKSVSVGVPAGRKTQLAEFFRIQPSILKDGWLGGALSTAWPLQDLKAHKIRLSYGGVTEVNDRPAYRLKSEDGDLRIAVYIDGESFRHVRTEYEYSINAKMGVSSTDIQGQRSEYKLIEDFGDFKQADTLVLPFTYTIAVNAQPGRSFSTEGTAMLTWTVKFAQAFLNEKLDPGVFKVS